MPLTRSGTSQKQQEQSEHEGDNTVTGAENMLKIASVVEGPAAAGKVSEQPRGLLLPPSSDSDQFFTTLMETITRAQTEANKALVSALMTVPRGGQHSGVSSPAVLVSSASPPLLGNSGDGATAGKCGATTGNSGTTNGNFMRCTARFDGVSRDAQVLEAFLDAVEIYKECAGVSDEHAMRGLPMLLGGDAAIWWRGVRARVSSWTDAKQRLRAMYGAPRPAYKLFREVFEREQDNEVSDRFICDKRALLAQLPYRLAEEVQVDIIYGLLDRRIRKRVPRDSLLDLDDLLDKARIAEETANDARPKPTPLASRVTPSHGNNRITGPNASSSREVEVIKARCTVCRKFGHTADECRRRRNKAVSEGTESKNPSTNKPSPNEKASTSLVRCYGCGKPGVIRSKCDVCNAEKEKAEFNIADIEQVPKRKLDVSTSGLGMANHLEAHLDIGAHLDIEAQVGVEAHIGNGAQMRNEALVGNGALPGLVTPADDLGHFPAATAHIYKSGQVERGDRAQIVNRVGRRPNDEIRLDNVTVVVPEKCTSPATIISIGTMGRRGVALVDTGATRNIASPALYQVLTEGGANFAEVTVSIRLADGTQMIKEVLTTEVPVYLEGREIVVEFLVIPGAGTRTLLGVTFIAKAGLILDIGRGKYAFSDEPGRSYDFVQDIQINTSTAEVMRAESDLVLRSDEGSKLTAEQRRALNELIERRTSTFALNGPATDFATHHIKVSADQEPIASPPYKMSQSRREALQKELEKLMHDDVIEECESPWASNVVLVAKKDGTWRLCIDYRKLNAVTEPDRYPLPRIEDILHAAKTSEYMTTLDLRSGYHQVNVSPEDQDKTAFISPLGTFRWKRMPMGLRNSGATFQRLIDRFKSNLKGIELLAYLDDLVLLSPGPFERHLTDLEAVFDRLEMFKLRVNREKSCFARDSVKFLGHVIVPGGIQVDPGKTSAIDAMATPQNVRQLKCFLQTSSWFRRFIPRYAEVARPLSCLLKKSSVWKWEAEQQGAFHTIKSLLVTAPILRQADESTPFVLRTDSSGYCLGAVLMQGEGPDERPIEYASRLLTSAERNYSTTEREALAVVWAVSKFRGYIEGAKIYVKTDHQPLRWLMNQRSPSGRLARWALTLQEFDLDISYTPGRSNVIADTLSRPVCAQEQDGEICLAVVDMPKRGSGEIRENQRADPEVCKIIDDLESDEPSRGRPWSDRGYVLSEGILYRYSLEADDGEGACLVVPEHERKQVMEDFHDAPTAGHLGVERTISRIRTRYYWPGMRTFVTKYIKGCVACQRYKADNRKPTGLLQTPAVTRRFEVVSVDLFGPLVETPRNNRWILIVEDVSSRWVELFPLENATSAECAQTLTNEVFLRYGVPRRLISDNGVQFVSEIMQQACHVLGIKQSLTPYYHPEANPIERKNRDLKPQLAILVGQAHDTWDLHLASVRFAMNSAVTASTGFSPAYLTFGRELRAPADSATDMRAIIENDNFVPGITPYLKRLAATLDEARDTHEKAQEVQKRNADKNRRPPPEYLVGDLVLLKTQGSNDVGRGQSAKFIPRRDGPYRIQEIVSPTTFMLESTQTGEGVGKYHVSHLTSYVGPVEPPVREKRRRGRPRRRLITEC